MKIAFDAKRFFQNNSGLGNYSRDLIRILANYFPNNDYLLINKKKTEKGADVQKLPNVHFLPLSKGSMARQMKMGKDAQNQDADIFHGLSGELPLRWNKNKKIKKIVTIHDLIFMRLPQYYSFFDRKIHFWKFKKAAINADLVIAISEQTKLDIIHYLKIPAEKIKVVYQGCHQAFKEPKNLSKEQEIRDQHQLPEHFILNVGTIESRKNLLNIVKALINTNIPLVVVGRKTDYYKKVEKLISTHKMEKQIIFLENIYMENLAHLYRMADIFVYPSEFEGFGIPVIEALFSETAVITSNTSSLPEAGGPNSLYINPENVADISAKIKFLWDNESERKRIAEKGLKYAQKFQDQVIAEEMISIYKSI